MDQPEEGQNPLATALELTKIHIGWWSNKALLSTTQLTPSICLRARLAESEAPGGQNWKIFFVRPCGRTTLSGTLVREIGLLTKRPPPYSLYGST